MKSYTVNYERDETGWWIASVKEVPGCHTQGRSIAQARRRIREALSLYVTGVSKAKLIDEIQLPKGASSLIAVVKTKRLRVEEESAKLRWATEEAIAYLLKDFGVSMRDAGELLSLSHQRVNEVGRKIGL